MGFLETPAFCLQTRKFGPRISYTSSRPIDRGFGVGPCWGQYDLGILQAFLVTDSAVRFAFSVDTGGFRDLEGLEGTGISTTLQGHFVFITTPSLDILFPPRQIGIFGIDTADILLFFVSDDEPSDGFWME